jgi:hypothetical protein
MGEPVLALLANRVAKDHKATVEFDDPRLEYRRLFSEVWGTFLLVLVAAGGGVIGATVFGGDLTLAMKALAPGIMVLRREVRSAGHARRDAGGRPCAPRSRYDLQERAITSVSMRTLVSGWARPGHVGSRRFANEAYRCFRMLSLRSHYLKRRMTCWFPLD